MYLKAFIFGSEGVGKTELNKYLTRPGYVNKPDQKYFRSIVPEFNTIEIPDILGTEKVQINFWDASGNPHFKTSNANMYYSGSNFGLFCIDLSVPIEQQIIDELKLDFAEFIEKNPDAVLILVGTKSDLALPDALKIARHQLIEIPFQATVSTSARQENESKELCDFIISEIPKIALLKEKEETKQREEIVKYIQETSTIFNARNRCIKDSELYLALDNLNNEVNELPPEAIKTLGKEANALLDHLYDSNIKDKTPFIQAFVTNCNEEIKGKNYGIKKAILSFAITVAVTVIAAMIGFGIGFALGAWSGPGAFFTGLAMGSASAVSVVTIASIGGIGTLAYTANRFFKTTPLLSSISLIAEKADKAELQPQINLFN